MNKLVSLISKLRPELDAKEMYGWAFEFEISLDMGAVDSEQAAINKIIVGYVQDQFDSGIQPHSLVLGHYEAKVLGLSNFSNIIVEIKQNDRGIWISLEVVTIDSLHAILVK